MNKAIALKVVNAALAILIVTQASSGFFRAKIGYEAFEIVHEGGAVVLLLCVAAHIALNWNWVRMAFGRRHA